MCDDWFRGLASVAAATAAGAFLFVFFKGLPEQITNRSRFALRLLQQVEQFRVLVPVDL